MTSRCRTCGQETTGIDSLAGQCARCLMDLARTAGEAPETQRQPGHGHRFGDYLLVRRLGVGPLGTVHEAIQESTGRRVALKRWNAAGPPSGSGPGGRLPWPAAELQHPGIVTVHAHGQRADTAWVAMEFMAEGSLARWLDPAAQRGGIMASIERFAAFFAATALALDHAHQGGIVHAGIKPENLLYADGGRRLLLSDFAPANGAALQAVSWLGHADIEPRYLAPEQAAEPASAGPRSDVYSLAACLVDAVLASARGSTSESTPARSALDLRGAEIPAALLEALRSSLADDPRARPTAAELQGVLLEAWGQGRPARTGRGVLSRARRLLRTRRERQEDRDDS